MTESCPVYARALARHAELRREMQDLELFLALHRRFSALPQALSRHCRDAPIPDYQLLLECYRSGQMAEQAWQRHLKDERFRAWVEGQEDKRESQAKAPTTPGPGGTVEDDGVSRASGGAGTPAPNYEPERREEPTPGGSEASPQEPISTADETAATDTEESREGVADHAPEAPANGTAHPPEAETAATDPSVADSGEADGANAGGADDLEKDNTPKTMFPRGPEPSVSPTDDSALVPDYSGLSERQEQLLRAIHKHVCPPRYELDMSFDDLSALSSVPAGSVSYTVIALAKKGRIARHTSTRLQLLPPKPAVVGNPSGSHEPKVDVERPAPAPAQRIRDGFRPPVQIHGEELCYAGGEIALDKPQRLIVAKLLENWGQPVKLFDILTEITTFGGLNMDAAVGCTTLKYLAALNDAIKPAGIVVMELARGKWRVEAREQAGSRAA